MITNLTGLDDESGHDRTGSGNVTVTPGISGFMLTKDPKSVGVDASFNSSVRWPWLRFT